jgi:crotonobetainyl-CoA:carnitine CoA-transferase CaiB-like acyl-CoA transferase
MSETPPVVARRAPLLGEHTRDVLREAGYSDAEIAIVTGDGS